MEPSLRTLLFYITLILVVFGLIITWKDGNVGEGQNFILAGLVDRREVRVSERRGRARLAEQLALAIGIARDGAGQDLQRDEAAEVLIAGAIHNAHPALAELLQQLKVRDALTHSLPRTTLALGGLEPRPARVHQQSPWSCVPSASAVSRCRSSRSAR